MNILSQIRFVEPGSDGSRLPIGAGGDISCVSLAHGEPLCLTKLL